MSTPPSVISASAKTTNNSEEPVPTQPAQRVRRRGRFGSAGRHRLAGIGGGGPHADRQRHDGDGRPDPAPRHAGVDDERGHGGTGQRAGVEERVQAHQHRGVRRSGGATPRRSWRCRWSRRPPRSAPGPRRRPTSRCMSASTHSRTAQQRSATHSSRRAPTRSQRCAITALDAPATAMATASSRPSSASLRPKACWMSKSITAQLPQKRPKVTKAATTGPAPAGAGAPPPPGSGSRSGRARGARLGQEGGPVHDDPGHAAGADEAAAVAFEPGGRDGEDEPAALDLDEGGLGQDDRSDWRPAPGGRTGPAWRRSSARSAQVAVGGAAGGLLAERDEAGRRQHAARRPSGSARPCRRRRRSARAAR